MAWEADSYILSIVAMGSPVQEYLMQDMHKVHPAIYQGLGGSFDVYTGTVRRAPKWFADRGLEGVYRAFWEPRKRLKGVLSDVWFLIALKTGQYWFAHKFIVVQQ